jgi:hypothetical protein
MLAALSRCEQRRQRIVEIDPRAVGRRPELHSLASALAESTRLERILADLETPPATDPEADQELPAVVHEGGDGEVRELPADSGLTTRERHRGTFLSLAVFVTMAALVVAAQLASDPRSAPASRPPQNETTIRFTGVVVSRSGSVDVREGQRCEIVIADSGDREAGRECRIDVRCPTVSQGFVAASCPIGEPKGPVRMDMNGLEIDAAEGMATFISWDLAGSIRGGARVRLDPTR